MRKITYTLPLLLLGALPCSMQGQVPGGAFQYLDGNQVKARVLNVGSLYFDEFTTGAVGLPLPYTVPKAEGKVTNFASSLWIGGHDASNNLHLAAQTYRQSGVDFYHGPYRTTHNYATGTGFDVPKLPEEDGIAQIDNGKTIVVYDHGFTIYDPVNNISTVQTIPALRSRLKAVLLSNGKTMLFGDNTYPTIQDVYIADPANGYSPQVSLQLHYYHRHSAAVTLQNGKTLLAGLMGSETYDPSTNLSTTIPAMPVPVNGAGAILLNDGRVLVAGGVITFSNYNTGRIETQLYDPGTNTWTLGPSMPSGRVFPLLVAQPNGRILIIGGSSTATNVDEFDPLTNTISSVGQIPFPTKPCYGGSIANGDILLTGGVSTATSSQIMRYTPSTGTAVEEGFSRLMNYSFVASTGHLMAMQKDTAFIQYDPARHEYVGLPMQKVWKVTKAQITQFLADRANSTVNWANYPDIQTWPAMGDPSQGEDTHLAPFVDVDNDGLYRPLTDGDYPCVIGDQTLWWMYHDDGLHTESGGAPIGIQVAATAYVFDCSTTPCPDTTLDYTSFYHYEIINKGSNTLVDAMVGIWNDYDLGNWADDFIGTDTSRSLAYVYNGDATDETGTGFGVNPPAAGALMLGNSVMTRSMTYNNDFTLQGNPTQPDHYYNLMDARWLDGTRLVDNGLSGYDPQSSGPFTDYIYYGDPGQCSSGTGWTEMSAGNSPFDRRIISAHGPFEFAPGQKLTFDYAQLYSRDLSQDNFGNVCSLLDAADAVRTFWNGLDKSCFTLVLDRPNPVAAPLSFSIHPNPAASRAQISLAQPSTGQEIRITELSGRELLKLTIPVGTQAVPVDISGLPAGMYLVTIGEQGARSTQRLSIQR